MQAHRSDPRILGRRTLERDHRRLAELLRPGMCVLDVGCGTGAITAGIAKAIGPEGTVVGVDRDDVLLDLARKEHAGISNLRFERGDAAALPFRAQFDIVTSARTLQWIAQPQRALATMTEAAKPGGMIVVLDYSHSKNAWSPEPPPEFVRFYTAFLDWRQANGWDNEMAENLPELLSSAGLADVESVVQDEIMERGEPDFEPRAMLWAEVIDNVGDQLVKGAFCTTHELEQARSCYEYWVKTDLTRHVLSIRCVTGVLTGIVP